MNIDDPAGVSRNHLPGQNGQKARQNHQFNLFRTQGIHKRNGIGRAIGIIAQPHHRGFHLMVPGAGQGICIRVGGNAEAQPSAGKLPRHSASISA